MLSGYAYQKKTNKTMQISQGNTATGKLRKDLAVIESNSHRNVRTKKQIVEEMGNNYEKNLINLQEFISF